ncbi:MAG: hypothetical protein LBL27_02940, partial [Coriobacteriales bacterium]|nr:hypothetical protein [Coriobacteriales bacterium]
AGDSGGVEGGGKDGSAQQKAERKRERQAAVFAPGDMVDHKTFGKGEVITVDGETLNVRFTKTGQTKTLLQGYAPLVKLT